MLWQFLYWDGISLVAKGERFDEYKRLHGRLKKQENTRHRASVHQLAQTSGKCSVFEFSLLKLQFLENFNYLFVSLTREPRQGIEAVIHTWLRVTGPQAQALHLPAGCTAG